MLLTNIGMGLKTLGSFVLYLPLVVLGLLVLHVAGVSESWLSLTPVAYVLVCVARVGSNSARAERFSQMDRQHNLHAPQ